MATPQKRWPNNAEWARLDALSLARRGRQNLAAALDEVNDPVLLRKMAKAIDAFREIESKLQAVGPNKEIE